MIPFKDLLKHKTYRKIIGRLRLFYFLTIRRKFKTLDSEFAFDVTIKHNLKSLKAFGGSRMDIIIRTLSIIETLDKNSKILIIGPRNEADLLGLIGYGFRNIKGLDLITYSPMIVLGDMHKMPFEDNSFDVVISGWTLSYSNTPELFAEESMRVVKDEGIVAIGVEYGEISEEQLVNTIGYSISQNNFERINSTKQILNLYEGKVKEVILNHDATAKRAHKENALINNPSAVVTIFSVEKQSA